MSQATYLVTKKMTEDNYLFYLEIYKSVSDNIRRENDLANQRLMWAISLTSGVLTAESFLTFASITTMSDHRLIGISLISFFVMAILSAASAYFSYRTSQGVAAALDQLDFVKEHYRKFKTDSGDAAFEEHMHLPRPFGDYSQVYRGRIAARIYPSMMMFIWGGFCLLQFSIAAIFGFSMIYR